MKIFSKNFNSSGENSHEEKSNWRDGLSRFSSKFVFGNLSLGNATEKPLTLVDKANDPIVTLVSKKSSQRGSKSKKYDKFRTSGVKHSSVKIQFDCPKKHKPFSPSYSSFSFRSIEQSSIIHDKQTYKYVRDFGIQCQAGYLVKEKDCVQIHEPIFSLQTLVERLKAFSENLYKDNDKKELDSLIYNMNFIVKLLLDEYFISPIFKPYLKNDSSKYEANLRQIELASFDELEKTVGITWQHLQALCQKMEEGCMNLREENEAINKQFHEKCKELEMYHKNELQLKSKLNEVSESAEAMAEKMIECTTAMEKLKEQISTLEKENKKILTVIKEKNTLSNQISDLTLEKERSHLEVQLMLLEKEKFRVLLEIKNEEIECLKEELRKFRSNGSKDLTNSVMASGLEELSPATSQWVNISLGKITPFSFDSPIEPSYHKGEDRLEKGGQLKHVKTTFNLKNELRGLFTEMRKKTDAYMLQQEHISSSSWSLSDSTI